MYGRPLAACNHLATGAGGLHRNEVRPMITTPTHEQITALAAAVRGNTLTRMQRDQAALVLGMIGSALRTAAQAVEGADGDPASAAASVAGEWEPGRRRNARLLAGAG